MKEPLVLTAKESQAPFVQRRKAWMVNYARGYRQIHKAKLTKQKRDSLHDARTEGIAIYGGKCSCCGEDEPEFLTLEHLKGYDGPRHGRARKRLTGVKAFAYLKARDWPKDGYTILCFNCNCAKGKLGYCPPQRGVMKACQ